MNNYLVSILMPAYNHEKYILDAIQSILNQSHNNIELLITDDCSSDKTYDIIKSVKDKRITSNKNKSNLGTVRTLNNLINKANGDYIAFCGSDDIWNEKKIEKQLNFLNINPEYQACFTHANIIDENDCLLKNNKEFDCEIFNQENLDWYQTIGDLFLRGNYLCQPSCLIKTDITNNIGNFSMQYRQLHDYDFWMRFVSKYKFYIYPERLVNYRRLLSNNNSLSANTQTNFIRMQNEKTWIIYNFINNLESNIFYNIFKDDTFYFKDSDKIHEICDKYQVLRKWSENNSHNHIPEYLFIQNYISNDQVLECLERTYNIKLNDIYNLFGKKLITYPMNCYERYEELLTMYKSVVNSKSWKYTQPLRNVYKKLKK